MQNSFLEIDESKSHFRVLCDKRIVDNVNFDAVLAVFERNGYRRVEMPCLILQSLIIPVIIYTRPASNGPAIVKLPVKRSVGARSVPAPEFRGVFDTFRLARLAQIYNVYRIFR